MSAYKTPTGPIRPTSLDAEVGRRLAYLRATADMDQYALSEALTAATGWRWSQNIISRIELGQRPIRLTEAVALATMFNTTVDALTGHAQDSHRPQTFAQLAEVRRLQRHLRQRERGLLDELNKTTTTTESRTA